jgi:hypothetical protein
MAFHIPFEHRRNGQPIYIGFNSPPRRRAWNWWAFFGFPMSIAGLLTAGLLSPIAFIVNLVALRKQPRRLASFNMVLSVIGIGILTVIGIGVTAAGVSAHRHQEQKKQSRITARQVVATQSVMKDVAEEFAAYRDAHDGSLPEWMDASMVATSRQDAWGQPLRFDPEGDHAILRSSGADKSFYTDDDVSVRIDGKVSEVTLLPVETSGFEQGTADEPSIDSAPEK